MESERQKTSRILIVEDDRQIRDYLRDYLGANGYAVSLAASAGEGRQQAKAGADLALVDRLLPGEEGIELCGWFSEAGIPVIFLTALAEEEQRLEGLLAGADDYVSKPFSPRELLARIRIVLRRRTNGGALAGAARAYRFSGWHLDLVRRKLFDPMGARIYLRSTEFNLLQVFCENPGCPMTRQALLEQTATADRPASERSIDITVSRLRRQIEPDPRDPTHIVTVRHEGYLFTPKVTVAPDP